MNQTVLLTGASGFLGGYIWREVSLNSNSILTLGRSHLKNSKNHTICDIAKNIPILPSIPIHKVIHIAGKAHTFPKTALEEQAFYDVNLKGTDHLLQALERQGTIPKIFINISTVAVYGRTTGSLIRESDKLAANTPYGISKLKAEKLVEEWAIANNCYYLNLRLPLIAGENPPGNLGNMKTAIVKGRYPRIKNNQARKSIVVASDIATFIANIEGKSGTYNLTDGIHPSFKEIENAIQKRLKKNIKIEIPQNIANFLAKTGDALEKITKKTMPISTLRLTKITSDLTFDDTKARKELGWQSTSAIKFIEQSI